MKRLSFLFFSLRLNTRKYRYFIKLTFADYCYPIVPYLEITYSDGEVVNITREKLGRIDEITDDAGTPYTYAEYTYVGSRVAKRTYPLGANDDVDYEISYNDLGQAEILDTHQDSTTIAKFEYSFDDNGNITDQIFHHRTASPDNDYTYDTLDRLTDVDYHDGSVEWFDYDKLGNRVEAQHRDIQGKLTYARNAETNRYDQTGTYDIKAEYDQAGNTTKDPNGYQYTYDYENRIVEIKDKDNTSIVEYAYDALGRRIQKYDAIADDTTRYYYNNNWQVLTETDENDTTQHWFIYGNYIDEVLVMVAPGTPDDVYYYTHDHLYSPVALLDDDGDIIERYEYDAYGMPTIWNDDFTDTRSTSNYGNPYYFTGREADFLDNAQRILGNHRWRITDYYTGRWLTHDPFGYIDGMNMYEYVSSNSVISVDPYGNITLTKKIFATLYWRCFGGRLFNLFRKKTYDYSDDHNEMMALSGVKEETTKYYKSLVVKLVGKNDPEINKQMFCCNYDGFDKYVENDGYHYTHSKPKKVGRWHAGSSGNILGSFVLNGAHAVYAQYGSFDVCCNEETGVCKIKNINFSWRWYDQFDANSFSQLIKNGEIFDIGDPGITLRNLLEGYWDIFGDKILNADFYFNIYWVEGQLGVIKVPYKK